MRLCCGRELQWNLHQYEHRSGQLRSVWHCVFWGTCLFEWGLQGGM